MIVSIEKQKDNYGVKMLLIMLALFFMSVAMFYKIQQNNPISHGAMGPISKGKQVYILKSYSTAIVYKRNSIDMSDYVVKLDRFKNYINSIGYETKYINEDKINTLSTNSLLFIPDAIALSIETKNSIKNFLRSGGNIFFNFTTGFSDESGQYIGDSFVQEITKLQLSKDKNFLNFKDGLHLTQRLLSVLNNPNSGLLLDAPIYDAVPIFTAPVDIKPDIFMTNYEQTNPPLDKAKKASLEIDESGAAWHGYYGKGKWFYLNLPSYVFYESKKSYQDYISIFDAIVNFLSTDVVIGKFPYIDKPSAIFVSEDTEYKFKNFKKFSTLAKKYEIPVTAFIVSSLAQHQDHQNMVREISYNSFVEFASHSHSHKKIIDTNASYVKQETSGTKVILDKFTSTPIIGFRPPREELDAPMKKTLADGGFKYVLSKTQEYLYPKYDDMQRDLMIIPRHGTDDYSYLINLDWDSSQIVDQMIKESNFVTAMDGIYTLSLHTHLFAYSSNIKIIEDYFKYLKDNPELTPMNGRMILDKVEKNKNIKMSHSRVGNTIALNLENRNSTTVENFHCKIFKNPNLRITSMVSDQTPGSKDSKNRSEIEIKLKYLKPNSTTTVFIELVESI